MVWRTGKAWLGDGCRHLSGLSKCPGYQSPLALPACIRDTQTGQTGKPHWVMLLIQAAVTMSCQQFGNFPQPPSASMQLCLSPVSKGTSRRQPANPLSPHLPANGNWPRGCHVILTAGAKGGLPSWFSAFPRCHHPWSGGQPSQELCSSSSGSLGNIKGKKCSREHELKG